MKYYHCSNRPWKVGDIIHARADVDYTGGIGVYVSTRPEPHYTLYENGKNSVKPGMRLYEVRPLGKVKRGNWDDLVCLKGVEVIASLGEVARNGIISTVKSKNKALRKKKDLKTKKDKEFEALLNQTLSPLFK